MSNHGKGGRPPDPTHLKLVKGVTRRERVNYDDPSLQLPVPDPDALECPDVLTRSVARDRWSYYARRLAAMGVLTEWDVNALEGLCEAYADMTELRAVLTEEGRFYHTYLEVEGVAILNSNGQPIIESIKNHPAASQYEAVDRRFRHYLGELGLTPVSRSRVKANVPEKAVDPAERHFG